MQLEKILKDGKPVQKYIAYILKDRSNTINAKVFEMPKYGNFRPVIRFILGLPVGEIQGESLNDNLTPGNDYDYWERQQLRKIEYEKIEAVFELNGLGSSRSADDKKLKTMTIKKEFGTTSKTEIEKMEHTELNYLRQELEEMKTVENIDKIII